jgi:hypothetical protein
MELEPLYVDTTIRRWQDISGQSAIHQATGKTLLKALMPSRFVDAKMALMRQIKKDKPP